MEEYFYINRRSKTLNIQNISKLLPYLYIYVYKSIVETMIG